MTKLDAGLITSLPASDPGSAAVWGSKRINPRPQFYLCLAWSGCPSNDDDDDDLFFAQDHCKKLATRMFIFFCFSNHYLRVHWLLLFFYVYLYIYFPDLIHRVSNYSDLLPEMPRFCYPLIEIRLKLRTGCQDHQAGKSAVKCLSQGHKRMVRVDFELRPC